MYSLVFLRLTTPLSGAEKDMGVFLLLIGGLVRNIGVSRIDLTLDGSYVSEGEVCIEYFGIAVEISTSSKAVAVMLSV